MGLISGVASDGTGNFVEIPLAVDLAGNLLTAPAPSGGGTAAPVATAANQTTGNTSLSTISADIAIIKANSPAPILGGQPVGNSLAVATPRKLSITGFTTTTTAANANLLDATGLGAATDVRDYQSGEVIVTGLSTGTAINVQVAFDAAFTIGVNNLVVYQMAAGYPAIIQSSGYPIALAAISRYSINLQGVNYIKVQATNTPPIGVTAYAILSQAPHSLNFPQHLAGTTPSQSSASNSLATINANGVSQNFVPYAGISRYWVIDIASVTGTNPTLDLAIEESIDGGLTWRTTHQFETITAVGRYISPLFEQMGAMYRLSWVVGGTSPSFNYFNYRMTSSIPVARIGTITRSGGLKSGTMSVKVGDKRILKVNARNSNTAPMYIQFHNAYNSAGTVATGAVPLAEIYAIPATNGYVNLNAADFGNQGESYGANTYVVISSTEATYTPPTAPQIALLTLNVKMTNG